jgi:hypothetical protein
MPAFLVQPHGFPSLARRRDGQAVSLGIEGAALVRSGIRQGGTLRRRKPLSLLEVASGASIHALYPFARWVLRVVPSTLFYDN